MEIVIIYVDGRHEIAEYDADTDTYTDARTGLRIDGPVTVISEQGAA